MSFHDKLFKIEALIQQASSEGERSAAALAKERLLAKISNQQLLLPKEYTVSSSCSWEKELFVALCHKNGLSTYRYYRQKYTTTCVRVSKVVMDEILWPEYLRYTGVLKELVDDITQELIKKIHKVVEDEVVIAGEIGT